MAKKIFALAFVYLTAAQGLRLYAQNALQDFKIDKEQIAFTQWFDRQVGNEDAPIYNGPTYPLQMKARFGHQFFASKHWENGKVYINGQWFFDLALLFDILDEQLVVKPLNSTMPNGVAIDMSALQYFQIGSAKFVALGDKKNRHFYEVLFAGHKLDLVARRLKTLDLEPDGYHVEESNNYFLLVNGELAIIRNKGILKAISPNAKFIARQIKSKEAKFSLRKEELLVEFMRRFDEKIQ